MIRFDIPTIDGDTTALSEFWRAALHLIELEREDGDRWVLLGSRTGTRVLGLQQGTHCRGGIHLDLGCEPADFETERARLLALGATESRNPRIEHYGSIANLADPHGNPFDLCAYQTRMPGQDSRHFGK